MGSPVSVVVQSAIRLGVLMAAVLFAVLVSSANGPVTRSPGASASQAKRVSAASPAVFVQDPYMGVSCHVPNSIACDRIGLAVWLARPASVRAWIAGAPVRLNDPTWSYVAHDRGRPLYVYAGFLHPAGVIARLHVHTIGTATWLGANAPTPMVRFRIDYGQDEIVTTQEHVWLHAGWG